MSEGWWATPGGGLEPGETFEQAAIREAAEELAMPLTELTPLWEREVEFSFRGNHYRQLERYFLIRVARADVLLDAAAHETRMREGIANARWWTPDEIDITQERVYPEDLPQRLRELSASA